MSGVAEKTGDASARRKTSMTIDAASLDQAKELGLNVSAVCEAAIKDAVRTANRARWIEENRDAFERQRKWHEDNDHPFAGTAAGPLADAV